MAGALEKISFQALGGLPFPGVLEDLSADLLIGWLVHYNDAYSAPTRAAILEAIPEARHGKAGGLVHVRDLMWWWQQLTRCPKMQESIFDVF